MTDSPTKAANSLSRSIPTLGLLPVLAVTTMVGGQVQAQEAEEAQDLGTIVLKAGDEASTSYKVSEGSSSKLTAPLIDTPKTITVITQKQIEERGAVSLDSILRGTPGVTLGTGEGGTPYGTRPYVRGFEASSEIAIDGVRHVSRGSVDSFNLESVEVTMGADGVMNGRGSAGGNINLVTKAADTSEDFNKATFSVGNADQYRATLDSNKVLGEGLAARLNLLWDDSGVPGRDKVENEKLGAALAVTKEFSDTTSLSFKFSKVTTDGLPDYGVPMWEGRPLGVDPDTFYGLPNRDFRDTDTQTTSIELDHAINDAFTLKAGLHHVLTEQDYIITRPSTSDGLNVARPGRGYLKTGETMAANATITGEVELGGLTHSLAFGVEATKELLGNRTYSGIAAPDPAPAGNPDYSWVPGTDPVLGAKTTTETKTRSLFLFDTIDLNENWKINGGLRYEYYDVSNATSQRRDELLNGQIGVMYKPNEASTYYLSYTTSSSPAGECVESSGGTGGVCNLNEDTANSEPEKTRNIELGGKWEINGGDLMLTAALFQTEKRDQRVEDVAGDLVNAGHSRSRGLDLGISGQINENWGIFAGYTYLDAKVIDDGAGTNDGNELMNTAPHTFTLWTTYQVTPEWLIGGGATYAARKYTTNANNQEMPSYWKADLMTSYAVTEDTSLQLNIDNIFDERFYDSSHQGAFATVAPGRSVTLKLSHSF